MTGWFTEDFTVAEIKTLRVKERLPFRNQDYNGRFSVPTFEEVLDLARRRNVGIYPETKHPTYFRSIGLPLEEPLLAILASAGLRDRNAPVYIQSFESGNLRELRKKTAVPLIQLLEAGQPFDLAEIAGYADGIGPDKRLIVPVDGAGRLQAPTSLVDDAHRAGLLVHPWTFRSDRQFLAPEYEGEPLREYEQFFSLGVDGVFSDFADTAVRARSTFWSDFK